MLLFAEDTRSITKKIVRLIVTTCTGFTVSNVLSSNSHVEKTHQKVEVLVGSMVVGSLVADKAGDYTDEKVDDLFDSIENISFLTRKTKTPA